MPMRSATRERIKPWVDAALRRGDLMGFGHRVYRGARPPRGRVEGCNRAIGRSRADDLPFAGKWRRIFAAVAEEKIRSVR